MFENKSQLIAFFSIASVLFLVIGVYAGAIFHDYLPKEHFGGVSAADTIVNQMTLDIKQNPTSARTNLLVDFKDKSGNTTYRATLNDLDATISNLQQDTLIFQAMRTKAITQLDAQGVFDFATSTP